MFESRKKPIIVPLPADNNVATEEIKKNDPGKKTNFFHLKRNNLATLVYQNVALVFVVKW